MDSPTLSRILVVDDEINSLQMMARLLREPDREVVCVESGADAITSAQESDFAVIMLDVQMPGLDGFATAEAIRQIPRACTTPLIFVTGTYFTDIDRFKGYALGAVDYLFKPFSPTIIESKVRVFVDLFKKSEQIRRQAVELREAQERVHARQIAEERTRRETEFRVARAIQSGLFPRSAPALVGFDVAGLSRPMEATGGDYFDYFPMPNGALGIAIGDASGHGFGPALLMAETRAYLRALALTRSDLGEIMKLLNAALEHDTQGDYFVTLLLLRIHPTTRALGFASAGHTSGYVLNAAGELRAELSAQTLPLGVVRNCDFTAQAAPPLEHGDLLLLCTDGIPEAMNAANQPFGLERTLDVVRANRTQCASAIAEALYQASRTYSQHREQQDDMTTIVVKVAS